METYWNEFSFWEYGLYCVILFFLVFFFTPAGLRKGGQQMTDYAGLPWEEAVKRGWKILMLFTGWSQLLTSFFRLESFKI